MATAYSYIRFSTPEQLKGDSLRRQVELSERYAREHGLELDTSLKFTDLGVSAFDKSNLTKGSLGKFIDLIKSGRIARGSYLLVESLDRMSRVSPIEALGLFTSIINAGVKIVTLADRVEYSTESMGSDPTKLLFSILIMIRANEESETKSKRVRAAWENKRKNLDTKILTQRCPSWIRPNGAGNGFELIEERADIVRKIFDMAKSGLGNSFIIKFLNEKGVPNFSPKAHGWYDSYVQKILKSPTVYGEFQPKIHREGKVIPVGNPIENYYPAVIDKEEWLLINSLRESRSTGGGSKKGEFISNLFSGLLKCGYCNGSMTMGGRTRNLANGQKSTTKYVACQTARRGLNCHYKQWNYYELERILLSFCSSIDFSRILNSENTLADDIEKLQKNIIGIAAKNHDINSKLGNIVKAIESGVDTSLLIKRIKDLEFEKLENEKTIESLEIDLELMSMRKNCVEQNVNDINNLIKKMNELQGSELLEVRIRVSELIHQYIDTIVVYPFGRSKKLYSESNNTFSIDEIEEAGMQEVFEHIRDVRSKSVGKSLVVLFKDFTEKYVYIDGFVGKNFDEKFNYSEKSGYPILTRIR